MGSGGTVFTRRKLLKFGAAGAAASVPFVGSALFSQAEAAEGLPLIVENNTGQYPNSAITMYIVGTDLATGQMGYVREAGKFTPISAADNGSDGYAKLGVPLNSMGQTTFALPKMSGRIYFAINGSLKFKVVTDGNGKAALQYPVGWAESDPNFNVLHDCAEFTYSNDGMFCNTTQVDMFSIPMAIRLQGANGEKTAGVPAEGGRNKLFDEMKKQPGFEKLVVGSNLRIIAPGHGMGMGRFSSSYFDPYINEIWSKYASQDLKITTLQGSFTGRVSGGQMTFSGAVRPFSKPSTKDVLFCDGALLAPNDGLGGPVAAILGAGFNRSCLGNPNQPTTDAGQFYQGQITNHYSRLMHKYHSDGLAYGFPFDDVTEKASYTQDSAPKQIRLTLTPFGGGAGPGAVYSAPDAETVTPETIVAAPILRPGFNKLPADKFASSLGVDVAGDNGTRYLTGIGNGDWVSYTAVDFGDKTATQFKVDVASGAATGISGLIEIRLDKKDGPVIGSIAVASTGGWANWKTVPGNMAKVTGKHNIFLTFTSAQKADYVNVAALQFSEK
jgi:hypothetical protein